MSTGTQVEVVMPQMGVSVSEGTITRWLKQPGDSVTLDEPLLEISTDKVDTEVPSPGEGVVTEIRVQEGETVEVGTVLAVIAPAGTPAADAGGVQEAPTPDTAPAPVASAEPVPPAEPVAAASDAAPEPAPQPAAATPSDTVSQAPSAPAPEAPAPEAPASQPAAPQPPAAPSPAPLAGGNGKTFVSPVVARIAAEHGVDPGVVPGTGQGGRVTKKDILAFIESGGALAAQVPEAPPAPEQPAQDAEPQATPR